ncbi:MAG: membrane protein insertion efficiency factor YidD [Thermosipho sp. (in: Bacteria)]|nr:membrane protein insertion efficiency factor YidD [Thermosipho sp. (in: thermotogales)]
MRKIIIGIIRFYQKFISPLKPPTCIYTPTCSEYTLRSVKKFGVIKGLFLGFKRILRCNPMNEGGEDPVPDEFYIFTRRRSH